MINISSTKRNKEGNNRIKSKKLSQSIKQNSKTFNSTLQNSIIFNFKGTIENLLTDLSEQEKRFCKYQSLYELERYKALIQKILRTIIEEGFKSEILKRTRNDRADFFIVKKIDQKLLDISSSITNNTNNAFNLLKTIEEIRGLLLDLIY